MLETTLHFTLLSESLELLVLMLGLGRVMGFRAALAPAMLDTG